MRVLGSNSQTIVPIISPLRIDKIMPIIHRMFAGHCLLPCDCQGAIHRGSQRALRATFQFASRKKLLSITRIRAFRSSQNRLKKLCCKMAKSRMARKIATIPTAMLKTKTQTRLEETLKHELSSNFFNLHLVTVQKQIHTIKQ